MNKHLTSILLGSKGSIFVSKIPFTPANLVKCHFKSSPKPFTTSGCMRSEKEQHSISNEWWAWCTEYNVKTWQNRCLFMPSKYCVTFTQIKHAIHDDIGNPPDLVVMHGSM